MAREMPRRDEVDPHFDGHPDRSWTDWTADEKIDWIWEIMELRRLARRCPRDGSATDEAAISGDANTVKGGGVVHRHG